MSGVLNSPPRFTSSLGIVESSRAGQEPGDDTRWEQGFSFQPSTCGDGWVEDPCDPGARQPKITGREAILDYEPFDVVAGDECSAFGWAEADYEQYARNLLERCESKQIASELWTGTLATAAGWPNLRLATPDADNVTNGPTPVIDVLACLEQALAECACGERGMIHASRQLVTHWAGLGPLVLRREGGLLLTVHDTVVVSDAGYDGTGPNGETDNVWAYATSWVTVKRGPVSALPGTLGEALDRTDNTVRFFASRPAAAFWDGCCHFSAESNIAPCAIGGAS